MLKVTTRNMALAGLSAAAIVIGALPAAAEIEYPYCIINGGRDEGSWSCGYQTMAQCQATRVGTDMCVINPRYNPAAPQRRKSR